MLIAVLFGFANVNYRIELVLVTCQQLDIIQTCNDLLLSSQKKMLQTLCSDLVIILCLSMTR